VQRTVLVLGSYAWGYFLLGNYIPGSGSVDLLLVGVVLGRRDDGQELVLVI
jgi:NhaP-type Na+/H+ or K+/H+ antiporter